MVKECHTSGRGSRGKLACGSFDQRRDADDGRRIRLIAPGFTQKAEAGDPRPKPRTHKKNQSERAKPRMGIGQGRQIGELPVGVLPEGVAEKLEEPTQSTAKARQGERELPE